MALLRQYPLDVQQVTLHAQTHHPVYSVLCAEGAFMLRVQPLRTRPRLEREAAHVALLAGQGLPVPTIIPTKEGQPVAATEEAVGLLMQRLEGERVAPHAVDVSLMARLGELLAALHAHALPQHALSEAEALFSAAGFYPLDQLLRHLNAQQRDDVQRVWRFLQPTLAVIGDRVLHGDVVLHNVLINGQRLVLVDWEYTRVGDVRWDLASLLWQVRPRADAMALQAALLEAYAHAGGEVADDLEAWLAARQLASLHWVAHNRALMPHSEDVIARRLYELVTFIHTGRLTRA